MKSPSLNKMIQNWAADLELLRKVWAEALGAEDGDFVAAIVNELSVYFNIPASLALTYCKQGRIKSKEIWNSKPRNTEAEILGFYNENDVYIFEEAYYHTLSETNEALKSVVVSLSLQNFPADQILEFGCGIGTTAILIAQTGAHVTLADVSKRMLALAKWRIDKRSLSASYLNLLEEKPTIAGYDVVIALDVLEHVSNVTATISELREYLKPSGLLIISAPFGSHEEWPMHIVQDYRVLERVRSLGFRRLVWERYLGSLGNLLILQRADRSSFSNMLLGLWDTVYWRVTEENSLMRRLYAFGRRLWH